MNSAKHHTKSSLQGEHGTVRSYVIGFLLSLLFTFIPYFLVVNKVITGFTLLVAILGIAVIQMVIQIVFFLHFGRGPKPFYNEIFFVSTVGIIFVVVGGSMWIMHHLNYNMIPEDMSTRLIEKEGIYQIEGELTGACRGVNDNHQVVIEDGAASPVFVQAQHCDTLSFINQGDEDIEIRFGTPLEPYNYGGETHLSVRRGRSKTLTLNQSGTFQFYDHHNPDVGGAFSVAPESEHDHE